MKNEKAIERFSNALQKQLEVIESLRSEHSNLGIHRKLLYVAAMDALSKSVFPRRSNRDRFISFVRQFSEWGEADRISLPHLNQLFQIAPDPAFEGVRQFAKEQLIRWAPPELIHLARDPEAKDVQKHWPKSEEHRCPIAGIDLEKLRHVSLLFFYRNSLVHELRPLGYGIEFSDDIAPFYMMMDEVDDSGKPTESEWELVYPVGFFQKLATTGLRNLRQYLLSNDLNPMTSYQTGSFWLEGLNIEGA